MGVWQTLSDGAFQTNPFCLYLLTSIPKRQSEGLAFVTHATVDGGAVLVYVIILLGAKIIQAMLHIVTMQRLADAFHKYHGRLQAFSIKAILYNAYRVYVTSSFSPIPAFCFFESHTENTLQ